MKLAEAREKAEMILFLPLSENDDRSMHQRITREQYRVLKKRIAYMLMEAAQSAE